MSAFWRGLCTKVCFLGADNVAVVGKALFPKGLPFNWVVEPFSVHGQYIKWHDVQGWDLLIRGSGC